MMQPGASEMKCFQVLREFAHVSTICSGSVLEKCVLAKGFMRLLLGRGVSVSLGLTTVKLLLLSKGRLFSSVGYKMLV